ncbi:MAG: trypsin-like peptidase domain-containing protein, partial [Pseudonocardiaceae bacterium]
MNGAAAQLRTALSHCVVRLSGEDCRGGSGFFVAPGYVVTCAHVVADVASPVLVAWKGINYEGIVRFHEPTGAAAAGQVVGYPDLAVVQLAAAPPDQPCVWLWLGDTIPDEDTPLYAFGYNTLYGRGDPELAGISLIAGGPQKFGGETLIRVKGDELPQGTSGGPIIDLTTGRVTAMVKTTRQVNTPYGGIAMPLDVLRRVPPELRAAIRNGHDSYHASDGTWPAMVDRLRTERQDSPTLTAFMDPSYALPMLSAQEEAELMGLLANLPPSGNLSALFRGACWPYSPDPGQDLLDRWDMICVLDDLMAAPRWALPPLLAFVDLVAEELLGERAAALRAWNDRYARHWG